MSQHPAGTLVDDLEGSQDEGEIPGVAMIIDKSHPVDRQGRLVVAHENAARDPVLQHLCGLLVALCAATGHVDKGDVVGRLGLQRIDLVVGEHVVRRCGDARKVSVGGIPKGTESTELRHATTLPEAPP